MGYSAWCNKPPRRKDFSVTSVTITWGFRKEAARAVEVCYTPSSSPPRNLDLDAAEACVKATAPRTPTDPAVIPRQHD